MTQKKSKAHVDLVKISSRVDDKYFMLTTFFSFSEDPLAKQNIVTYDRVDRHPEWNN